MSAIFQPTDEMTAPAVLRIAPVNEGAAILDDLRRFLCRFVAFPDPGQAEAVALGIVHSHAFDAAETTPRLSIQSAEKRSGKSVSLNFSTSSCARRSRLRASRRRRCFGLSPKTRLCSSMRSTPSSTREVQGPRIFVVC